MELSEEEIEKLKKEYELTDEEYQEGLAKIEKVVFNNKMPVDKPTMILVGGQQGSGKTQLLIRNGFEDGNVVMISLDEFTVHHPRADEIKEKYPDLFAALTLEAGRIWRKAIYAKTVEGRYNGMTEMIIQDEKNDAQLIRKLKERKYNVKVRIMATSLYESVASVYERYEGHLRDGKQYPRLTECTGAYSKIPNSIQAIENSGLADEISVYKRGEYYIPTEVYSSTCLEKGQYGSAREALEEERRKDEKRTRIFFL